MSLSNNSGQSTSLRSRKVDVKKPLAIVLFDKQNDIEIEGITSLPAQVATGVEKGEEEEHHLQAALVARHQVVIPTPDASGLADVPNYEKYYTPTFKLPKAFIKFSQMVEEVIGCLYNVNDDDLDFIKTLELSEDVDQDQDDVEMKDHDDSEVVDGEDSSIKIAEQSESIDLPKREPKDHESIVLEFEKTMFLLDHLGNEKPVSLEDAKAMIDKAEAQEKPDFDQDIITKIYEYWKSKRYSPKQLGKSLLPVLKSEEMSANPDNDPYVCFRRREIKLQRKVRRSDTLALDKLRKLKGDMTKVKEILEFVKQREQARQELLSLEHLIFEKRIHLRRLKRFLGVNTPDTLDASPERPRKRFRQDDSTKIRIPFQNVREAAALASDIDSHMFDDDLARSSNLKIEEKIKRERAIQEKSGWLDCTEKHPISTYWGPHLGIESSSFHVSSRRRIGRGGRVIFDRHLQLLKPSVDCRIQDPAERAPNIFASPSYLLINYRLITYRGFELDTPKDMSKLLNRETHPSSFDPTKPIVINTTQPEIVRPISTPSTQKRRPKLSDKSANQSLKKKTPEEMKAAQVKEYLKQAQQQAQMNHQAQMSLQKGGLQSNQGSPLAYASSNGPQPQGPNNRQLSQMLLPTTLSSLQQSQLSNLTPYQQAQFFQQPNPSQRLVMSGTRMMYIPTMGQSTIHLGPDGMIRMKQGESVVNEDLSAEMGAFVNSDQGEKEIAA